MTSTAVTTKDRIVFGVTLFCYGLFIAVMVSSFSSVKVFRGKYFKSRVMKSVFHPSFGVYTRRPGEPIHQLYKVEGNRLKLCDLRPFVPQYWFGLKRDYKTLAAEVEAIVKDTASFQGVHSVSLNGEMQLKDLVQPDTLHFANIAPKNVYTIRGKYVITIEPPLKFMPKPRLQMQTISCVPINVMDR